jgi:cytochrome P450
VRAIKLTASTLLHPDVLDEPYDFYRTLRTDAPVWAVPGTDVITVSTFDLITEAVGRPEDFSSRISSLLYRDDEGLPARLDFGGTAPPTLATADPPLHTTHRKAVFPELVARRMLTLEGDIRALCETAIDGALRNDPFEFMGTVGNVVPITVVAKLIGFRDINPAQLLEAAFDSTAMIGGTMTFDRLNELVTRIVGIQGWIGDQVAGTTDADDDGILLAVRRALDAGTLQEGEVQIILHTLLSAGGETTSSLVGNAVRLLADDPELQQRLREKPELIDTFVEEGASSRISVPSTDAQHSPRHLAWRRRHPRWLNGGAVVRVGESRFCTVRQPGHRGPQSQFPASPLGLRARHPLLRRSRARPHRGQRRADHVAGTHERIRRRSRRRPALGGELPGPPP